MSKIRKLTRLSKIFQGGNASKEDLDALTYGTKHMTIDPKTRDLLHQAYGDDDSEKLLNLLAEVYLHSPVRKADGGKVKGALHFLKNKRKREVPVLRSKGVTPEELERFLAIAKEMYPRGRSFRTWETSDPDFGIEGPEDESFAFPADSGLHADMMEAIKQYFNIELETGMGITADELRQQLKDSKSFTGWKSKYDPDAEEFAEGGEIKKKKPNKAREVAYSMSRILPMDDESADTVEDTLARILLGLQSQLMTTDPETGETYFAGIEDMKNMLRGGKKKVYTRPGLIDETISIPSLLDLAEPLSGGRVNLSEYVPDASREAADRAAVQFEKIRDDMGLDESQGFRQVGSEALGIMLGQLPIPVKAKAPKSVPRRSVATTVGSIPEWFSPTVNPSVANYSSGAALGGGLGVLGDTLEARAQEEAEWDSALNSLAKRYIKTGNVVPGFSRSNKFLE